MATTLQRSQTALVARWATSESTRNPRTEHETCQLETNTVNGSKIPGRSLKKPYDDGTTAISMSPMELMERLAAMVPRPKIHLTRFSGVFTPHYKYRALVVLKPPKSTAPPTEDIQPSKARLSWARLLKRVFGIDIETCQLCGGKMKIIAAIEDPPVIRKILEHLDLPTKPPPIWPARGPPRSVLDLDGDIQHFPDFDFA